MSDLHYVLPYEVTTEDRVLNDDGEERFRINLWSLDKESKPYLVRIEDFPIFCWLELPSIVNGSPFNWDNFQANKVFSYISKVMDEKKPIEYHFEFKQKLYYYQGDRKYPMMMLKFNTLEAMNYCKNLFSKPRNIYGLGSMNFNIYEAHIDPIRKFMTVINADFCSWLNVSGEIIPFDSHKRISTQGTEEKPITEILVSYKDIKMVDKKECESWFVFPRILAFDIETYSDNHKAMPNSLNSLHVCNIISCIYYEVGKLESRKKYVFVLGDSEPVEGATVVCVNNEIELIKKFAQLVIDLDPEIISGYNIFAYDYPYLENRLKTKMEDWPSMSRLLNKPTEMLTMKWKSGAYGTQLINMLNFPGRFSLDLLPIVKRDYRLDMYNLDFVSKYFIGQEKHDVKPVDMFRAYEQQKFVYDKIGEYLFEKTGIYYEFSDMIPELKKLLNSLESENDNSEETGKEIEYINKLLTRYEMARKEITRIVAYCVQDSNLVIDLFDKLNVWLGLNALSSVVGVTIIQLFTRGQQIRCLSQVFDKCFKKGIVLDKRIKDKVFYAGGFVFEPQCGLYDNVACLDFASLYPSIMRAYNICFTTLVAPDLINVIGDDKSVTIEVEQEEPETGAKAMKSSGDGEDNDFFSNEDETEESDDKKNKTVMRTYNYKWVNKATRYGVLPEIQDHLVGSRNIIKKELAALEDELEECTDPKRLAEIKLLLVLKDKYSNALKVSANSLYGFLGAQEGGVLSLIEAAMCITFTGRRLIGEVNNHVITKHNGTIVYGDSVTGDTPILIRINGVQKWKTIETIVNWMYGDIDEEGKCRVNKNRLANMEVWSDMGWTKVIQAIRHKTSKGIYKITTETGVVKCTEDHSLIKPNGDEVKTVDVNIGFELLHVNLPAPNKNTVPDNIDIYLKKNSFLNSYTLESAQAYQYYNFMNPEISGNKIINIEYLGNTEQYVYDLETQNHHFAAGVGRIIVHNTDSSMVDLHIPDKKAAYAAALALADEISGTPEKKLPDGTIIPAKPGLFPPPLKIEFEKLMKMLSIKKKKYAALLIDKNGEFIRDKNKDGSLGELKILKRGIIVARRDTAKIVHKTYNKLLHMILTDEPVYDGFDLIMKTLDDLVNDRFPFRGNLTIIRSLGDNYKSDSYFMKVFGDELIRVGKPANPSDRLEYVIVKTKSEEEGEKDVKLGLKMRLIDMYEDSCGINSSNIESIDNTVEESLILGENDPLAKKPESVAVYPREFIDYEYYIEHIMMSSLDQLFSIGYSKELEPFKSLGYTPQFCRRKSSSIVEPIGMMVKMLIDYKIKGYSIEQSKPLIPYVRDYYGKILKGITE
jgi:DNA polymerase elongation subunit (family B)